MIRIGKKKNKQICDLLGITPHHFDYYEACECPCEDDHVVFDVYPILFNEKNINSLVELIKSNEEISEKIKNTKWDFDY